MPVRSLPGEQWRLVEGTESIFVSSLGRVKKRTKLKNITISKDGYKMANIHGKPVSVHSLVAKAFIPNPNNYPVIDHIDGDKTNNNVNNLEWVTHRENCQRYYNLKKTTGDKITHRTTNIVAIDSNNNIEIYDNQTKAADGTGVTSRVINNILRGVTKTCKGFRFVRAETITDKRTVKGDGSET